jgi:hypothetical protein
MVVIVEGGCFLANGLGDGVFEVHTNILKSARGKGAIVSAMKALTLGFFGSNAETFVTKVPANNLAARWFTKEVGFHPTYLQRNKWPQRGRLWDVQHYRLDIDDWILGGVALELGKQFHGAVEESSHLEDYAHDCYVGAACSMVAHGKAGKAIRVYNRWARAAGYEPLGLVSSDPVVIDARDFFIRVESGQMYFDKKEYEHA